jgi:ABC-type arginine transport system permease subunit
MKWLVRLYPRAWRERYGEEFEALLKQQPATPPVVLDVVRAAARAQASHAREGLVTRWVSMLRVLSVVVLIQLVYWGGLIALRQPAVLDLIGEASYETVRDVLSMASIVASLSVSTWMVSVEQRGACWPFRRRAS